MQKSKKLLAIRPEILRQLATHDLVHVDGAGTPPVSGTGKCGTSTRTI